MEQAVETRLYPIWVEAAEKISDRVSKEGYGFLITWSEINELLEIGERQVGMTPSQMDAIEFDKLNKTVNLTTTLLIDHNICLKNKRNSGYEVLPPDRQVTEGFDHKWNDVRKGLRNAMNVLVHVDEMLLSEGSKAIRDRNMQKAAFVIAAANKRKVPQREQKELN